MPFFSVVSPLYNKSRYIRDTVVGVLNQSFKDFEFIVVDDGSTDNSAAIFKEFKDERIKLIQQENLGASIARINGIKAASGSYIALLDADDIWQSNHLSELYKLTKTFPQAVLFCTNYQIKRKDGFITPAIFNFEYDAESLIIEDYFKANIINYIASSSSSAFRLNDYLTIEGYRTELRTAQDLDLWIQFALKGSVAFSPEITMTYNFYDYNSLSNSHYNDDRILFVNSYKDIEKDNKSLKHYLDINRYAIALRLKILGSNQKKVKQLRQDILSKNLNLKQKVIIRLPRLALLILKKIQRLLIRYNIYLTAYD